MLPYESKSLIPKYATLLSNMAVRLVVNGQSGTRYDFPPSGILNNIELSDVDALLAMRYFAEGCCGGREPRTDMPYFTRIV